MMFSKLTVLSGILLASIVLAAHSSQPLARLAHHHNHHQLGLTNRDDSDPNVEYYTTWSGAIWDEDKGDFTTITGTFSVPAITGNDGVGSAWIGIDGRYCSPGLLQAGVDFWPSDGGGSYHAWYQWFPADSYYLDSELAVSVGDVIKIAINATSTTSGNVVIENLTTKQVVRKALSYPNYPLCLKSVEWIIEDYNGDSGVPLVDFGSVTFTHATARGPSGKVYTPSGATIAKIQQNGTVLTSVTTNGSSVTISYI